MTTPDYYISGKPGESEVTYSLHDPDTGDVIRSVTMDADHSLNAPFEWWHGLIGDWMFTPGEPSSFDYGFGFDDGWAFGVTVLDIAVDAAS